MANSTFERYLKGHCTFHDIAPLYKSRIDCRKAYVAFLIDKFKGEGDRCECCKQPIFEPRTFSAQWNVANLVTDNPDFLPVVLVTTLAGSPSVPPTEEITFSTLHTVCFDCFPKIRSRYRIAKRVETAIAPILLFILMYAVGLVMYLYYDHSAISLLTITAAIGLIALALIAIVIAIKAESKKLVGPLAQMAQTSLLLKSIRFHDG